jgi:hypothetical protein
MFPTVLQVSARLILGELAARLERPATFDDVEDEDIRQVAARGFDWVWLMGVWQTGEAGRRDSLASEMRPGFRDVLPDFTEADVCGSPFAVKAYTAHADFGGDEALARLRARLHRAGLKLMLDFVPNHTALDHAWTHEHPEYYVGGNDVDARREPRSFVRVAGSNGLHVLAHGRDPYFPPWTDTLQLNYRHVGLRAAMLDELLRVAGRCDGIRCDMAMLLLPHIFRRTWGERSLPRDGTAPVEGAFWHDAILRLRSANPEFLLLAEGYWNLEATLQLQGFDYTYDKTLYDRVREGDVAAIREHLSAEDAFQRRCARFLENHDEQRAAAAFQPDVHQAAAVLTYLTPGMRLFHEGQLDGRRVRASIHLARRVRESPSPVLRNFYSQLLACLRRSEVRHGGWRLLERRPAWAENPTWRNFLAYQWRDADGRRLWVVVNFGPTQGQCYVTFEDDQLRGREFLLRDQMSRAWYQRDGDELADRGLYLDLPAWGYHLFDVTET